VCHDMSHVVECCAHNTSVDGEGTSVLLDQKLCYQMFVSVYVNVGDYSQYARDE